MAEYIEREALISEFKRLGFGDGSLFEKIISDGVYIVIEAAPAVSVPQWINVKDRLPEAGENPVLAGCEQFNMVFMAWYQRKTKRWELPSGISCEVTHWMPTSSLPRMDGAE